MNIDSTIQKINEIYQLKELMQKSKINNKT